MVALEQAGGASRRTVSVAVGAGDGVDIGTAVVAGAHPAKMNTKETIVITIGRRLGMEVLQEGFPVYITSVLPSYPSIVGFIGLPVFP
jgi:hypothetical protein